MQDNTHPKERAENMDNDKNKNQTTPPAGESAETEQPAAAQDEQAQRSDAEVLEALMAENADLKDKMLRALAEVENIRRRSQKEREDTAKYAVTSLARELAGVADNLGRALAAVPQEELESNPQLQNIYTGVEATEKQLMRALENAHISKITPPLGEVFDPNFHEVMFETEIPGKAGGEIIEVMEAGYLIHDRLLRPARVGVAKRGSHAKPPEESENS